MSIPILSRGDVKRGLFGYFEDNWCPEGVFSVLQSFGKFDFGQYMITKELKLWAEWIDASYSFRPIPSASPQEYEGTFQVDFHYQVLDQTKDLYLCDNAVGTFIEMINHQYITLEKFGIETLEAESGGVSEDSNHSHVTVITAFRSWRIT